MRCPHCGGLNPDGATWCGQCMARFDAATGVRRAAPEPAAPEPAAPGHDAHGRTGPTPASVVKATEEGIVWTCARCATANPLAASACSVCDASFADTVRRGDAPGTPQRDPGTAALVSLFLPGAGHAYLGLWPEGTARAIISLWAVAVVFVAAIEGSGSAGVLIAVVFGVAALALWMVSAHDAYRAARGEGRHVLLKGRMYLYVVLGLLTMLVAAFLLPGLGAGR